MKTIEGRSKLRILEALAFFAVAVPAIAVPPGKTPQIPRIRVSTRLVKIGIIARDKNGPVTNLTKSDFVVLDRGKGRDISFFSMEASAAASHAPAASTSAAARNTFSDVPQRGVEQARSVTIVLLDNLNTLTGAPVPYEDTPYWLEAHALANAKQHLIEFLKHRDPNDRIAIYGLRQRLHVLCDFTCNEDELMAVVSKYDARSQTQREVAEPGDVHLPNAEDLSEKIDEDSQAMAAISNQFRAETTAAALRAIAAHVNGIPGRKNLLWLTANLPFSGHSLASILSPANISVYPVDARGLLPRSPDDSGERAADDMKYVFGTRGGPPAMSPQPIGIGAMEDIADDTGGRAFVNTNDLTGAIRQAVEDSELTYTLGFYIGQDSLDGKFHQLKIEVKRSGVTLRYPRGYFAFADTPATQDQNRSNVLAAVRSPIESSTIPVQVRIDRVEKPLAHCLSIFGSIEIDKLQLAENAGIRKGAASVITIEQDQAGKVLAQSASRIQFRLTGKEYAEYLTKGFPFHQFVQPRAGTTTLRILVEDTTTAEVGSLIIPLSQIQ